MKKILSILIISAIFCLTLFAQDKAKELDTKLTEIAEKGHLPGFGVAIVSKDKTLYQKGYGYADLANKKPYTKNTVQNIGSVSKTFIGVSLMKLVERGKLILMTRISDILPFKITNPYYPESPITIRQLATHTSTLKDTDYYQKTYLFRGKNISSSK